MHELSRNEKLDEILRLLHLLVKGEKIIMADLTALEAAVKANTDAEDSALTLITTIAAELAASKTDPAKVQALANKLNASAAALAAAVVANTPAAATVPDVVVPAP